MTIKDWKYWKINSANSLYLVKNEFNGYFLLIKENKYLTLVPINESKVIIKKMWSTLELNKNFISWLTRNPDDYDKKYMKIKFNSDDELLLNKTIEIRNIIIVVRAAFYENSKYYS